MLKAFYNNGHSCIIDEFGILWGQGQARVDIAVVNNSFHAYEIKSAVDTLYRLPKQIEAYKKVFDYITLAVSEEKYEKMKTCKVYLSLIKGLGLYVFDKHEDEIVVCKKVDPEFNDSTDSLQICHMLWKDEVITLLKKHGMKKGVASKPRKTLYALLVDTLSRESLGKEIRLTLQNRKGWRND